MIKIGTTRLDEVNYQGNIYKALKGTELIWEKNTIHWELEEPLGDYSREISIYGKIEAFLKDKFIVELKIGEYRYITINNTIRSGYTRYIPLPNSLRNLLGITNTIPANTKITVRYRNN